MIKRYFFIAFFLAILLFTIIRSSFPDAKDDPQVFADKVFARLLAVVTPPDEYRWPPVLEIQKSDEINAYTYCDYSGKNKKPLPKIVVAEGLIDKVVEWDENRMAFALAHELGHILHKDTIKNSVVEKTPFVKTVFNRDEEIAADIEAMKILLSAGYSYKESLKLMKRMLDMGQEYSSFEGLTRNHPSCKERLAYIDKEQPRLWESMSAFENGNFFLLAEQYASAELCFRSVIKEFPACYEAWSNLGYALLMQYCDALTTDDLREMKAAHIVTGAFYKRPESLESLVRGKDKKLWNDAVKSLKEALRLKPGLTLAKANLGVACLVSPTVGKIQEALKYLKEASSSAETDPAIDSSAKISIYINTGAAALACKDIALCQQSLEKAGDLIKKMKKSSVSAQASSAMLYNLSMLAENKKDDQAQIKHLENYLNSSALSSTWWDIAYSNYLQLCKKAGMPAKQKKEFLTPGGQLNFRPVVSVTLRDKAIIALAERTDEVQKRIGNGQVVPVVSGTDLAKICYPGYGIDILSDDSVLAIFLNSEKSPAVPIRKPGAGSKPLNITVGMKKENLEESLENEEYDFRQMLDPEVNYRFYRRLGVAVKINKGVVSELVIVQIPERSMPGNF